MIFYCISTLLNVIGEIVKGDFGAGTLISTLFGIMCQALWVYYIMEFVKLGQLLVSKGFTI